MTTNQVDSPRGDVSTSPVAQPKPQNSPVRLVILLALLGLVIGAYGYDYFVAKPAVTAASEKIQAHVDEQNKLGVKTGSMVTPDEIHKLLGMQPTSREVHEKDDYEIEYYRWWGHVPLLNTRRHYISIVYLGKEPRRFSSHYLNEPPPEEALPITAEPGSADGITLGQPDNAGDKDADAPAKADEPAAADAPPADSKAGQEAGKADKEAP